MTEVVSISLAKPIVNKLERARIARGQTRSAFIAALIDQASDDQRWQAIYKKGSETASRFKITSEEDIDRILHEA